MTPFIEGSAAERTLVELIGTDAHAPRIAPDVAKRLRPLLSRRPSELSPKELAQAIARGLWLQPLVRRLLDLIEPDPLASAGWFPGDLLRSLTEVPASFWRHEPELHDRYRQAVRAAAAARRALPADQRMEFWSAIPDIES